MKKSLCLYSSMLLLGFITASFLSSCKKSESGIPSLTTITPTSVTSSTASTGGIITDKGNSPVTASGVCYSVSQNPTTASNKLASSVDSGSFTSSLTGLSGSTTYYVRAYATNSQGTAYGAQCSFTTTAPFAGNVGAPYGGGYVGYIDSTGEHGLIIATNDLGSYAWSNTSTTTGATSASNGKSNTAAIIAAMGSNGGSYAALACSQYTGGGFTDWYLPSKEELYHISIQQNAIFNYQQDFYWSSTEGNATTALAQEFQESIYTAYNYAKTGGHYVRPIRSF